MKDENKSLLILSLILILGAGLAYIFFQYTLYAVPVFFFFPLACYFLFYKKVYQHGLLSPIWKYIYGTIFLAAGIYFILAIHGIVPMF